MNTNPLNAGEAIAYLRNLVLMAGVGVTLAVIAVVIADPYGLYRVIDKVGFNHVKPGLTRYQEQIKTKHALLLKTPNVIAGNSRAEIGLDPSAPALSGVTPRFYNLAVPGSSIETAHRQLAALQSGGTKLERIVLGLEFLDFIELQPYAEASSAAPPSNLLTEIGRTYFWQFDSLLSSTSLKDAVRTLFIQRDGESSSVTVDGFNPLNEYKKLVREDGYNVLFKQRGQENARTYLKKSKGAIDPHGFKILDAILVQAARDHANTILLIYPYHAQIMFMFEATGLMPKFNAWRLQLAEAVELHNEKYQNARVTLLDFSGYSAYNCASISKPGKKLSDSRWYWEGGHFKKELGDILLSNVMPFYMLENPDQVFQVPQNFGTEINRRTLIANEKHVGQARNLCLEPV